MAFLLAKDKVNHKNCKRGYGLINATELCNIFQTIPFDHISNSDIEHWITNTRENICIYDLDDYECDAYKIACEVKLLRSNKGNTIKLSLFPDDKNSDYYEIYEIEDDDTLRAGLYLDCIVKCKFDFDDIESDDSDESEDCEECEDSE